MDNFKLAQVISHYIVDFGDFYFTKAKKHLFSHYIVDFWGTFEIIKSFAQEFHIRKWVKRKSL